MVKLADNGALNFIKYLMMAALLILRCLCRSSPPIIADHQPIVAYHKLGRTLHRFLLVSAPYPFLAPASTEKGSGLRDYNYTIIYDIDLRSIRNRVDFIQSSVLKEIWDQLTYTTKLNFIFSVTL